MVAERIALDIALLFALITLPWWLSGFIVVALLFYFNRYYEAVAAGIILDIIFATTASPVFGFTWIFSVLSILAFFIVTYLKERMSLYA